MSRRRARPAYQNGSIFRGAIHGRVSTDPRRFFASVRYESPLDSTAAPCRLRTAQVRELGQASCELAYQHTRTTSAQAKTATAALLRAEIRRRSPRKSHRSTQRALSQ